MTTRSSVTKSGRRKASGSRAKPKPPGLLDILITPELYRREPRSPGHAAENLALVALAGEMTNRPENLLNRLVELALELCQAGSAGISLLDSEGEGDIFTWAAMAGVYASNIGGTTPRDFSPCGATLERGAPQLFFYPERYFDYFQTVKPPIVEGLVIPFYGMGRPLGTIWVVSHDEERHFDAEDARIMTSLGKFTGAALQVQRSLSSLTAAHVVLEQTASELRQAREVLQEADRRKDEFLATLAHELRNPLAPIRNSLHLLQSRQSPAPVQERAYAIIERQVQHLVRLVDDLLEVSRITRGKLELRREPVDVAQAAVIAVETSRPLIEQARHELVVHLPEQPLLVDADPVRLAQTIANLLNNAAKYTEPGGRISLTVADGDAEAVVEVRDSGIGMEPDMLPRVFEMFTQADGSHRHSRGGLGIGLALVRTLVQMHDGTVEAWSPGLGQGSTFTVRLPLLGQVP
jgi:signal transduction histidine kinase